MKELTSTQRIILNYIDAYAQAVGRAPTVAEIQAAFDYTSRSTVYAHLHRLQRKGYLENKSSPLLSRYALNLTSRGKQSAEGGNTPAQQPELRIGSGGDIVAVPEKPYLLKEIFPDSRQGDFLYQIWTNRYVDDGIFPGMTAIMRPLLLPEREGYALIETERGLRFRRFALEGMDVVPEGEESPYGVESSGQRRNGYIPEESPIKAVMIAAIDISFWV